MNKTIISFLNEAVEKYSERPFLYEARTGTDYTSLSYKEVQDKARQFAAGLMALGGIEAGDRVALISEGKKQLGDR